MAYRIDHKLSQSSFTHSVKLASQKTIFSVSKNSNFVNLYVSLRRGLRSFCLRFSEGLPPALRICSAVTWLTAERKIRRVVRPSFGKREDMIHLAAKLARDPLLAVPLGADLRAVDAASMLPFYDCLSVLLILPIVVAATPWLGNLALAVAVAALACFARRDDGAAIRAECVYSASSHARRLLSAFFDLIRLF